jgi:hypothetical protein
MKFMTMTSSPLLLLLGCGGSNGPDAIQGDGEPADCAGGETYPPGAVEPMALGETLSPYRWPEAVHLGTGQRAALDLADTPCATDPEIDWSPFDVLLFVSIPAW